MSSNPSRPEAAGKSLIPERWISAQSSSALEFDRFLLLLCTFASTDLGRERLQALRPVPCGEVIADRQEYWREVESQLEQGHLVPSLDLPLRPVLEGLESGARGWSGLELVALRSVLATTEEVRTRLSQTESCPLLSAELSGLDDAADPDSASCTDLLRRLRRRLDERGGVRDDATPKLKRVRQQQRQSRDRLYRELGDYARENEQGLSEDTVTLRDGRLSVLIPAGSRGRLAGMVRGRSGRGNSFYFEPAAAVEGNDRLEELSSEEAAERQRILAELIQLAVDLTPDLAARLAWLARLDEAQSVGRFSRHVGCCWPKVRTGMPLQFDAARHPLLDPKLADQRGLALGLEGNRGQVVPLSLELDDQGLLVITGPNAGGKTVALKTVGLLSLLAHVGLPVPAEQARVPLFREAVAVVGDQQDVLEERSTFSAKLHHLREVWEGEPGARLVLLDEIGSGTGPEEGAALAVAVLQGLLEERAVGVLTTHLTQVAIAALESEWAVCAAMGLDQDSQSPTFRLRLGPPAGSEALALARRMGLPTPWLRRAEEYLGSEHRDLRQVIRRVEGLRQELESQIVRARDAEIEAESAAARLDLERDAVQREKKESRDKVQRAVDQLSRENRKRLDAEVSRLRTTASKRATARSSASVSKALSQQAREIEGENDLRAEAQAETAPRELSVGDSVRHRGLGWEGQLESLDGKRAVVLVRGKRLRVGVDELLAGAKKSKPKRRRSSTGSLAREVQLELNLIGERVDAALQKLDAYLDQAILAGTDQVRVVHGHGTGRLREAVRDHLRRHPLVASAKPCPQNLGGNGATEVRFDS